MALFNSRKPLDPMQQNMIRELWERSRTNPDFLTEDQQAVVNELYSRMETPDTTLQKISSGKTTPQEGLSYLDKYGPKETQQELYSRLGIRREKVKGTPPQEVVPSSNNLTNVSSVIETEKKKQIIQETIEENNAPENIESEFENTYKINPFEKPEEAFNEWFKANQADPTVISKYFENGTLDIDNINESFQEALVSGKLDKEFGVIRPGDEPEEPKPEEPTLPTSGVDFLNYLPNLDKNDRTTRAMLIDIAGGKRFVEFLNLLRDYKDSPTNENKLKLNEFYSQSPTVQKDMGVDVMDWKEAAWNIYENPLDLAIFVKASKDAKLYLELGAIMHKDSQHQKGKGPALTEEEVQKIEEFIAEANRPKTEGAQIIEGLAQMAPFMQEFAATYGIGAILKKGAKDTAFALLKKETLDWAEKALAARGVQIATKTAAALTKATAMTELGYSQDAAYYKNLLPGLDISEDGERVYSEAMSEKDARRRARASTFIEYISEFSGPAIMSGMKKLSLGAKDVLLTESFSKALTKKIKKLYPNLNVTNKTLDAVRGYVKMTGYDGFFEEVLEERAGEGMRAFLQGLSDQGIIDGFEDDFAEGLFTNLIKTGNLKEFFSGVVVEAGVLIVPGAATRTTAKVIDVAKESRFKKKAPKIQKDIEASEKLDEESKEEYETIEKKIEDEGTKALSKKKKTRLKKLQSLDKLSDKQKKELTELKNEKRILGYSSLSKEEQTRRDEIIDNKTKLNINKTLKQIIIENPEIADEVDLSEVNLDEEVTKTRKELEEEYGPDFVTGEGMGKEGEQFSIMGYTVLANSKIKLGLKKGSTVDTVIEEYYGMIRRGGLTEEQKNTYDEHYDRYKTDKEYRVEINEFINDIHEKMGLAKPIADTSQALSSDKLFDKEGKSYEYKSRREPKQDIADKIYDYVGRMFKKAFGRTEKSDKIKAIYKKVQKRKLKISSKRAQRQAKKVKAKGKKPKKVREPKKKPKKLPKGVSYQMSVLDVSKKLAAPKEATEEDKVDVAVHEGLRETIKAIDESDDGIIHEALQWYFTSVDQTMDLSSNEVDIEDALDEDVYKMIIAINSQRTRPEINYNYAIDIFGHYQKNGTFNYRPTATTGKIRLHSKNLKGEVKIVGGYAGKVMTTQHKKLEFLFEKLGKEKAMNWLKTKHTGREILDMLEESGLTGYNVKNRPQHLPATVDNNMFYGAHMFGPKIGAFYANLSGRTDVATYDVWWTRTWNRWMGTPTSTTKKGKEDIVDVPRNMEERALMDEAINRIADALTDAYGYKFTPPAVQAILWYYEKELYIKNDADADLGVDFLRAAQNRAKEKGYATTPTSPKRARRVTEQRIAKEKRATTSLKEGIKETGKKARQKAPQVSYQLTDVKIPAQESKPSYQLKISDVNKIKDCPPGQCYRNAVRAAQKNPGSKVVQGRVYMPRYDEMKGHSWMEIENIVYDPAIDLVVKKEDFYNTIKNFDPSGVGIEVINELNPTTASILSLREGYKEYSAKEISEVESGKPPTKAKPQVSYQLEPTGLKTLYHVTPTKNLSTIKRVGLIPFQDTLWKDPEGGRLGDGSVFAFESLKDAQAWKRKIEEDPGLPFDDATILKIDNKDDRWNEDVVISPGGKTIPMNIMGPDDGRWFKRNETVKPEHISVVDEAKPSFQLAPTKPELFSPALRSIENLPQKSVKARGLMNLFKRAQVPPVELDWLGIKEWVQENYKPTDRVSKQDIIDYIKANQSKVIDVTLTGKVDSKKAKELGWEKSEEGLWLHDNWIYDPSRGTYTSIKSELYAGGIEFTEPKYVNWQEDNWQIAPKPIHTKPPSHEVRTMVGGENYTELLVRHPDGTFVEPSHWNIKGIIVSLRLTTRYDSKGNKVLFIEEIQSDWTSRAYNLWKNEVTRVAMEIEFQLNVPGPLPTTGNYEGAPVSKLYKPSQKSIKLAEKKVPKDFGYITKARKKALDKIEGKLETKYSDAATKHEKYLKGLTGPYLTNTAINQIDAYINEFIPFVADLSTYEIKSDDIGNLFSPEFENFIGKENYKKLTDTKAKIIIQNWINKQNVSNELDRTISQSKGMQDTPYKHTKNEMAWIKLGIKQAILHGVENNFDKIAIATPEQIEDMYDLSKQISEIRYRLPDPSLPKSAAQSSNYFIQVISLKGNRIDKGILKSEYFSYENLKNLEPYLGKGIIDKIIADDYSDVDTGELATRYIRGEGLRTQSAFIQMIYNQGASTLHKEGKRLDDSLDKPGTTDIDLGNLSRLVAPGQENIPPDVETITQLPSAMIDTPRKGKPSKREMIEGVKTSVVTRKSLDLTDNLKDKVKKTGIPSFQLKPVGKPLNIYDDITGKEKFGKFIKGTSRIIDSYNSAIIPISTLLKRINPEIYSILLKHQFNVVTRTNAAKEEVIKLDKLIKRMNKKDQAIFKLAMLNSDGATLRSLAEKYDKKEDFTLALMNVRGILDELREQLIDVGEEVGFIEEYYPRKVTDYDGLIEDLYGNKIAKALIEKQIAEKEKVEGRRLSDSEKADLINKLIRGYSYIKSKPSFIKTRKLDKILPSQSKFYQDPIIQLYNHMERVIERIENKKFFGASETSDESIGNFIQGLMDRGISLTDKQQKDLMRILGAYFYFEPTNSTLGAIKTGTYGILLGRFTNTITQMQDMVYGIYENKWNQIRTIKNMVRYFVGKIVNIERVKRSDVGADIIGQEFKVETKSGFAKVMNHSTNTILTGSGFKLMDGLGKSNVINSAIQKYKEKARKGRLSRKDKHYLKTLLMGSYEQTIEDLKKDTKPSEYTENELFIAYATLLKYQPIGRTEVPLKYLEMKSGRIFYMLKTFAIKQLNVLRDEGIDIITGRQPGNKKMAAINFTYLLTLMVLAGAGGDELKNWIKGKSESVWESIGDNLLKIILLNKYWTSKVKRESSYKGVFEAIWDNSKDILVSIPPMDLATNIASGLTEIIFKEEDDKKKSKLVRYIPWIGDVLYYRRDWSEFTGIGGRGKDDYTYRELNNLYKKSNTEKKMLNDRELKVYTQSVLDALNYPQTKLKKGKEVRRIDVDKHRKHLKKYGIKLKKVEGIYETDN